MSTSIYLGRIAAVFLFLVLSPVGFTYAITNGEPDDGAHPYVAQIAMGQVTADGHFIPQWGCSGSLIAPTVILTAGHCTNDALTGEYPTRALVWFEEQIEWGTWDPETDPTCAGQEGFPCAGYAAAASGYGTMIHTHPAYTPVFTEPPYGGNWYRDVGVIQLDTAIEDVGFAMLPQAGRVDELDNKAYIDVVGFGSRYQAQIPGNLLPPPPPANRWTFEYSRYKAQAQMISGQFSWSDDKMRLTNNPGGGTGGFAPGDSGGPDLLAGTDIVLAVNSYHLNVTHNSVGYVSRVDIPDVLEWIGYFLP